MPFSQNDFSRRKGAKLKLLTEIKKTNRSGRFCSLSGNVLSIDKYYINYKTVGSSWRDPADDMLGALGRFVFRIAVSGDVWKSGTLRCAKINEVGVYVWDSYDFNDVQTLGYWNPITNYTGKNPYKGSFVENADFKNIARKPALEPILMFIPTSKEQR